MPRIRVVSCLIALGAVAVGCGSGGGKGTSSGSTTGSATTCTPHCGAHAFCLLDGGAPTCACRAGYEGCPADGGLLCTNLQTDSENCSTCGMACTAPMSCSGGNCTCAPSAFIANCPGGECADLRSDPNHCGGCKGPTVVCGPGEECVSIDGGLGSCECSDPTLTGCASGCVDLTSDPFNCGCCGTTCLPGDAGGSLACVAGSCSCSETMTQCPTATDACGLCVDPLWDANNCNGCGNTCFAGGAPVTCDAGNCFCGENGTGFICPDFSCPDFDTDPHNCGGCGNICTTDDGSSVTCTGGMCFCGASGTGTICPDGSCPDFNTDVRNCGGCNMPCFVPTPYCSDGQCSATPDGGP